MDSRTAQKLAAARLKAARQLAKALKAAEAAHSELRELNDDATRAMPSSARHLYGADRLERLVALELGRRGFIPPPAAPSVMPSLPSIEEDIEMSGLELVRVVGEQSATGE